ncbi:fumarylacetoacetate hydrolase family protein [Naasia aerilata]|uniref:2-hydroxyhepta-2,4-diene-1,7-dioate isomerase n=1 Tax=Naasia aerilata TaxID=1162966 RepID=A0ABN6XR68_9MICO|nr:fumarylacetoacetate hydrolase family protein [Naasia aerilata]BDZ47479.1 2-hydroxyhepta-2,4-diene-1,7-dioate isomerase [Naasia aerilata]
MRLARVGSVGHEQPVVWSGTEWLSLASLTADIDAKFLRALDVEELRKHFDVLPPVEVAALRFGCPVARPGAVYGIGLNYAAHAAESGADAPQEPVLFMKPPNTVGGPDDDVVLPRGSTSVDWEVELAVVIGATASYLAAPGESSTRIAGYCVANDLSERSFQLGRPGGQWTKGKSSPGFTPLGPWLVTPDEFDLLPGVGLRSSVNGQARQASSTADMIFGVDELIWDLSQYVELEPGDVVLTGTPEGVALSGRFPYLRTGDVIELAIDGLGHQAQRVVEWKEARNG